MTLARNRKWVFFDFDGVIADSFEPAFQTVRLKCAHATEENYREQFEKNIHVSDKELTESLHGPECNHGLDWWETFIPLFESNAKLFPSMDAVIKELSHTYLLAIISSSLASPIQAFLAQHGIDSFFEAVLATEAHTDKSKKIHMMFEKYGIRAQDCVFVTDTYGDLVEAKDAGISAIGVAWGFNSPKTLKRGNPFCIVDTPDALPPAIMQFFQSNEIM